MPEIKDLNPEKIASANDLVKEFSATGFQASHLSEAVTLIEKMKEENCTVFLSFTANLIASGLRGLITELCRKKFVDVIITTSGSLDHDIIKSFAPYMQGSFQADDAELHRKSINRLGNIFIPTKNFELLEEKFQPMLREIYAEKKVVSPSELSEFIGSKLGKDSFLYWCTKNKIPVFCPGITDGAIGLQMYFFRQDHKDFGVEVSQDLDKLLEIVLNADKTGGIVLGGGIAKHHLIGSNIVRDGLDYAVYVTTAQAFDGSLSGAVTSEGKSWGKIKEKASTVTVYGDATILFPLIVSSLKQRRKL